MTNPQPAAKKSNTGLIIGIIVGVVVLVCAGTIGVGLALGKWFNNTVDEALQNLPSAQAEAPKDAPKGGSQGSHKVRYEVDGTGEALLNWGKGTGGQDNVTTGLPWNIEITVNADSFGAIVSAIPRGKDVTIKSCRILVDGKEVKKADAKNNFVTCTFAYVGKA